MVALAMLHVACRSRHKDSNPCVSMLLSQAMMVIRQISLQFSSKFTFNPICQAAMQCLQQAVPRVQAVGLELFGVVAEGCMESIANQIHQILPIIVKASQQSDPMLVSHHHARRMSSLRHQPDLTTAVLCAATLYLVRSATVCSASATGASFCQRRCASSMKCWCHSLASTSPRSTTSCN